MHCWVIIIASEVRCVKSQLLNSKLQRFKSLSSNISSFFWVKVTGLEISLGKTSISTSMSWFDTIMKWYWLKRIRLISYWNSIYIKKSWVFSQDSHLRVGNYRWPYDQSSRVRLPPRNRQRVGAGHRNLRQIQVWSSLRNLHELLPRLYSWGSALAQEDSCRQTINCC